MTIVSHKILIYDLKLKVGKDIVTNSNFMTAQDNLDCGGYRVFYFRPVMYVTTVPTRSVDTSTILGFSSACES